MKVIVNNDIDLVEHAGNQVWIMGITHSTSRILNPIQAFLYVEHSRYLDNVALSFATVEEDGSIEVLFDVNGVDDGTIIYVAKHKLNLYEMPGVVTFQRKLSDRVGNILKDRQLKGFDADSLFYDTE